MNSFLLALQFLTVLPFKIKEVTKEKVAASIIYFPVVGLLLGLLLAGVNNVLSMLAFSPLASSVILTVTLIVITAGIHLDGLSDTADAFLSAKTNKEEMLKIMRDPHIGVMGVLALISVILLKVSLLFSIDGRLKLTALVLMCVLSRWSVVLLMYLFPYARKDGKAGVFIEGMNHKIFIFSSAAALLCVFGVWQMKGVMALLTIAGIAYAGGRFLCSKIAGITGDTLGAAIELIEVIVLAGIYILERSIIWIK